MTKEDILHHFQDINFYYNDCGMYDDLSRMLDELISENKGEPVECARAIKEYCEKHECERCDFSEHRVLRNTDNYICRVHYACPCGWDLPEPYKKGGE